MREPPASIGQCFTFQQQTPEQYRYNPHLPYLPASWEEDAIGCLDEITQENSISVHIPAADESTQHVPMTEPSTLSPQVMDAIQADLLDLDYPLPDLPMLDDVDLDPYTSDPVVEFDATEWIARLLNHDDPLLNL